jgi:hypothetical protein
MKADTECSKNWGCNAFEICCKPLTTLARYRPCRQDGRCHVVMFTCFNGHSSNCLQEWFGMMRFFCLTSVLFFGWHIYIDSIYIHTYVCIYVYVCVCIYRPFLHRKLPASHRSTVFHHPTSTMSFLFRLSCGASNVAIQRLIWCFGLDCFTQCAIKWCAGGLTCYSQPYLAWWT